jgi:hypothetical protein
VKLSPGLSASETREQRRRIGDPAHSHDPGGVA